MKSNIIFKEVAAEMARKGINNTDLAKILDIHYPLLRHKMLGEVQWKKKEIDKMCKYFNKSYEKLFKEG